MSALGDSLEAGKQQVLQGAGFRWLGDETVWVQPETRQVISNEWARDHLLAELQQEIRERPRAGEWSFTSVAPMSAAAKSAISNTAEAHGRRQR